MQNILLDLDGVLSDFLSLALEKMDYKLDEPFESVTPEMYSNYRNFDMAAFYGVSQTKFWQILEQGDLFWCNLKPFPWAKDLYDWLEQLAPVTICTSPSLHPIAAKQKTEWVKEHLGLDNTKLMIGSRKYLMAKPGNILIDDYDKNTKAFVENGGKAILVPSNWNTFPLTYDAVRQSIQAQL